MVRRILLSAALVSILAACGAPGVDLLTPSSGGDTTTPLANRNAFSAASPNLAPDERRIFEVGDSFFTEPWVPAPATEDARDGLGPLFNAASCASCHVFDGRGSPPDGAGDTGIGILLRTGVRETGAMVPVPDIGDQLQNRAIAGVPIEGSVALEYSEVPGSYDDGTTFVLRRPVYSIVDGSGVPRLEIVVSPRIAPVVAGAGLLEAIPESAIRAGEDPDDRDRDGISGRANMVHSVSLDATTLGRFGWKANVATIADQIATAFLNDIGITSPLAPEENCGPLQAACAAARDGGTPEITEERMATVVFYSSTLAVPQRRNLDDPDVHAGAEIFESLNCSGCHTPSFTTGDHEIGAVSHQEIFPFTDLLLHDMGEGLADGKPDGLATGSEWRTPPLWGIGLVETVNGHTSFLHDGRARSLEEAILWHGGEAENARKGFVALDAEARQQLIAFLESL